MKKTIYFDLGEGENGGEGGNGSLPPTTPPPVPPLNGEPQPVETPDEEDILPPKEDEHEED